MNKNVLSHLPLILIGGLIAVYLLGYSSAHEWLGGAIPVMCCDPWK